MGEPDLSCLTPLWCETKFSGFAPPALRDVVLGNPANRGCHDDPQPSARSARNHPGPSPSAGLDVHAASPCSVRHPDGGRGSQLLPEHPLLHRRSSRSPEGDFRPGLAAGAWKSMAALDKPEHATFQALHPLSISTAPIADAGIPALAKAISTCANTSRPAATDRCGNRGGSL